MTKLNTHEDYRNRGLEVLLYHPEKNLENNSEDNKFKLSFKIPLFNNRQFNFQIEFFTTEKSKFLEKE